MMKTKFKEISDRVCGIVSHYPTILVMAFLASTGSVFMVETEYSKLQTLPLAKFTVVSVLGISLMFALKMLSQRIGKAFMLELLGSILLIGFYFILPNTQKELTEIYVYMVVVAIISSHLLVSFIAFLSKNKELTFWQYNKNLFINIFLTAVFSVVLTGGIELAVLAIDKLFNFNFSNKIYADLFYVLKIFGSCFIFLLFNERGLNYLEKDRNYPTILKFFTQFILIPLLFIYVIILYFYSFKILINWELPRGWVAYIILAYSIVGILALLLVYPLKEENTKSWVKIFSKVYYLTLIPLIILLFVAIFTRILEYGYTEPRYFVLILALWLSFIVIYFTLNKKASIKFIPISLFVLGIFSLIFPYFNAFSVTKRSQKSQLINILNENQLFSNNKINFTKKVKDTIADEIAGKFEFLAKREQKQFLLNLLDTKQQKQLAIDIKSYDFWNVNRDIRNNFITAYKTLQTKYQVELISEKKYINIENYKYLFNWRQYDHNIQNINGDNFEIVEDLNSEIPILKVKLNSKIEVDFGSSVYQLIQENIHQKSIVKMPEISIEKDLGKYHIKMVFEKIIKEKPTGKNQGIYYGEELYLLIREK